MAGMNYPYMPQEPKPAKPQEGRPALQRMECDQLKNLDRVLLMNKETMRLRESEKQAPISPSRHANINPYLLDPNGNNYAGTQRKADNFENQANQNGSQQHQRPVIAYPVVPFWTGCPLPFSPMSYPQVVIPQGNYPSIQYPIGPQMLRPVNPVNYSGSNVMLTGRNVPINPPNGEPKSPFQPEVDMMANHVNREQALNKYRAKRARRKWSHRPNPKLSMIAASRPRDATGKFMKTPGECEALAQKTQEYNNTLAALQNRLQHSEFESKLLREKLLYTEKELNVLKNRQTYEHDMYRRTFLRNDVNDTSMLNMNPVEGQKHPQSIFDPFKTGNQPVEAFREKIDFSQKRQDLKQINSPWLPANSAVPAFSTENDWEPTNLDIEELLSSSGNPTSNEAEM
eukprot:TRINITY_DN6955_c0_g1_i1.p1 TRINITY_DN6955_c0_g1~~TRINITY_DN6955_c0_g1_i1.p1  ORF type:complete len:399 (+),score=62.96 TRINITY_DN6955_c0_g1_i1:98-1294(+)